MRFGLLFALAGVLVACSSEPQSKASDTPDVVLEAPPSSTATTIASALPRREPPSALVGWTLPAKEGGALGAACGRATEPDTSCGTQGRVSLESQTRKPLGHGNDPPCKLERIGDDKKFSPNTASACIDGDYLVINTVCMVCRMPDVGSAVLARLSELTPAQHKHLGQVLMLPEEKTPTSADGWRQLVKKR
jgi:hypothetical protein